MKDLLKYRIVRRRASVSRLDVLTQRASGTKDRPAAARIVNDLLACTRSRDVISFMASSLYRPGAQIDILHFYSIMIKSKLQLFVYGAQKQTERCGGGILASATAPISVSFSKNTPG